MLVPFLRSNGLRRPLIRKARLFLEHFGVDKPLYFLAALIIGQVSSVARRLIVLLLVEEVVHHVLLEGFRLVARLSRGPLERSPSVALRLLLAVLDHMQELLRCHLLVGRRALLGRPSVAVAYFASGPRRQRFHLDLLRVEVVLRHERCL